MKGGGGGVVAWTPKQSKMTQPDLDYFPPEIQLDFAGASPASDIFSFGQLVCALYADAGRSLIQAEHNVANYARQMDKVRYDTHDKHCIA